MLFAMLKRAQAERVIKSHQLSDKSATPLALSGRARALHSL
jgi:hypothetical protein